MHVLKGTLNAEKIYFQNKINRLLSNPCHQISFTKYILVLSMAIPVQQSRNVNILLTESQIFWCYHQTFLNVVGIHKYLNYTGNNSIAVFIFIVDRNCFSWNVFFLFCNGYESNIINYYMNMIDAFKLARSIIRSVNIVRYNFNINFNIYVNNYFIMNANYVIVNLFAY